MRLRYRRPLAVGAATLLASAAAVAAVAVATPAAAAEFCYNQVVTISISTPGSYNGTSGNDVVLIKSNSGMTSYNPVGGRDRICADTAGGPITVWTAGSGHWVVGTQYDDVIYGSEGPDNIGGNGGNDIIKGNGGDDILEGYAGNDYIRGNLGNDIIVGGFGNDCLVGGNGNNRVYGEWGSDTLLIGHDARYNEAQCAPAINDTSAAATAFINNVFSVGSLADGGNEDDSIWGTNGNDTLSGSAGNDTISGLGGNDYFDGGSGSDSLYGGSGNDSIGDSSTENVADFAYGGPGTDTFGLALGGADVCYADMGPGGILPCSVLPRAQG